MKRKTLAIPIRLINFSDTSQILTLFTREHGVVEAIAKGAHRERNPFQGPFDLGVLWEVVFAERSEERGLSILTEGTVVEGFREVRETWVRWAGAAFVLEYLRTVGTSEPAGEMFDLTVAALQALGHPRGRRGADALEETAVVAAILSGFEARALRILGLSAPPIACSDCGRPWSRSDRPVFFSAQAGGILCGKCHQRAVQTMGGRRGLVVPGKALRVLEDLAHPAGAGEGPPASGRVWPETEPGLVEVLRKILDEMRTTWLERRFVTVQYVEV